MNLRSAGRVAGWAVYLGTSWTWCIGMFLPVLFLRDLGIWGFVAFAVPNIVGAAAMGSVITSPTQSRAIVRDHQAACAWFSLITIAFHGYFTAWLIEQLAGSIAGAAVAAAFAVFWLILHWRRGGSILAASLALAISLAAAGWAFYRGDLPYIAQPIASTRLPPIDLVWLAMSCIFGFGLCPYLDLTFHAARQQLGKTEARLAFFFGFAVVFQAMILFTLCYSGWLVVNLDRHAHPQLAMLLSAHLIAQSALTMALHVEQLSRLRRIRVSTFMLFAIVLMLAVAAGVVAPREIAWTSGGEIIYRVFLGFYALVAPVYVWLRVLPPPASLARTAVVIIIAIPLFWLAFIQRHMGWLIPGIAIPLAARYVARARGGTLHSLEQA